MVPAKLFIQMPSQDSSSDTYYSSKSSPISNKNDQEETEIGSDSESSNNNVASLKNSSSSKACLPVIACEKSDEASNVNEKRASFSRIWSEDDEFVILKTWIDYTSKQGRDPNGDTFLELVKDLVSLKEVSKSKLMDKLQKFRKNYVEHVANPGLKKNQSPHKIAIFELCAKIWDGDEANNKKKRKRLEENNKKKMKKEILIAENIGDSDLWVKYPLFMKSLEMEYGKRAMELGRKIGTAKAEEIEDEWRAYVAKKAELNLHRLELVKEQTRLQLDLLKKVSKN